MAKLPTLLFALVACSGDRQSTRSTAVEPSPSAVTSSKAAVERPLVAPSSCPVPARLAAADEQEHLGGEGEARVETSRDTCGVADSNLARVEDAILKKPNAAKPVAGKPWDKRSVPKYGPLVTGRLALSSTEKSMLAAQGFVVMPKHGFASYAYAFHEVYQSQLPIYVSVDAVLHAIYMGNDSLIEDLEAKKLAPQLAHILDTLACKLGSNLAAYPAETARDLDLYLAVARALFDGAAPLSVFGESATQDQAKQIVAHAMAASELKTISLFGRDRVVDFTAYTPRGHYAKTEAQQRYFRAAMWLSRLEFNLVSRSSRSSQPGTTPDPRETPREAVLALALADLVEHAGLAAELAKQDTAWALLAGRREDISVAQLSALRKAAGIASLADPGAAQKLARAIGDQFKRTARLHYMPQGASELPAIATLLGPRVVPDAAATRPLVEDAIPGREILTAADMAYVLGHDRALAHLANERAQFPSLDKQLAVARTIARDAPRGKADLYSAWLDAVMALGARVDGVRPSFMQTDAYADMRLASALLGFGHIKHNFVLIAGESYFAGGCTIPDGYVEPAPAMYAALIEYANRGERALAVLDPADELGARAYFQRLAKILAVLKTIGDDELAGRPLTADQKAFLSMVAEMEPGTTGGPPTYTGWWFDMFRRRTEDGLAAADFIASFFTGAKISYVGATSPKLGVFVVDTGGPPRMMVGPVGRAYQHLGPQAKRLDDEAGAALPETARDRPWEKSYVAPEPTEPTLALRWDTESNTPLEIESKQAYRITLETYDHHRKPIAKVTQAVKPGKTLVKLRRTPKVEGVHLIVGDYHGWFDIAIVGGGIWADLGGWQAESDE